MVALLVPTKRSKRTLANGTVSERSRKASPTGACSAIARKNAASCSAVPSARSQYCTRWPTLPARAPTSVAGSNVRASGWARSASRAIGPGAGGSLRAGRPTGASGVWIGMPASTSWRKRSSGLVARSSQNQANSRQAAPKAMPAATSVRVVRAAPA